MNQDKEFPSSSWIDRGSLILHSNSNGEIIKVESLHCSDSLLSDYNSNFTQPQINSAPNIESFEKNVIPFVLNEHISVEEDGKILIKCACREKVSADHIHINNCSAPRSDNFNNSDTSTTSSQISILNTPTFGEAKKGFSFQTFLRRPRFQLLSKLKPINNVPTQHPQQQFSSLMQNVNNLSRVEKNFEHPLQNEERKILEIHNFSIERETTEEIEITEIETIPTNSKIIQELTQERNQLHKGNLQENENRSFPKEIIQQNMNYQEILQQEIENPIIMQEDSILEDKSVEETSTDQQEVEEVFPNQEIKNPICSFIQKESILQEENKIIIEEIHKEIDIQQEIEKSISSIIQEVPIFEEKTVEEMHKGINIQQGYKEIKQVLQNQQNMNQQEIENPIMQEDSVLEDKNAKEFVSSSSTEINIQQEVEEVFPNQEIKNLICSFIQKEEENKIIIEEIHKEIDIQQEIEKSIIQEVPIFEDKGINIQQGYKEIKQVLQIQQNMNQQEIENPIIMQEDSVLEDKNAKEFVSSSSTEINIQQEVEEVFPNQEIKNPICSFIQKDSILQEENKIIIEEIHESASINQDKENILEITQGPVCQIMICKENYQDHKVNNINRNIEDCKEECKNQTEDLIAKDYEMKSNFQEEIEDFSVQNESIDPNQQKFDPMPQEKEKSVISQLSKDEADIIFSNQFMDSEKKENQLIQSSLEYNNIQINSISKESTSFQDLQPKENVPNEKKRKMEELSPIEMFESTLNGDTFIENYEEEMFCKWEKLTKRKKVRKLIKHKIEFPLCKKPFQKK